MCDGNYLHAPGHAPALKFYGVPCKAIDRGDELLLQCGEMSTNSAHSRPCSKIGAWTANDTHLVEYLMAIMLREPADAQIRPQWQPMDLSTCGPCQIF